MPPLQVNVKVKSAFNNKLFALNVVVNIPVPDNTAKADIQTSQGQLLAALHVPARCCCLQARGSYFSLAQWYSGPELCPNHLSCGGRCCPAMFTMILFLM